MGLFKILFLGLCLTASVWGAQNVEELRMEKRFGLGFSAGGALSILGLEADVNLTEELSIGGGLGTGLDYSSLMLKARYLIPGRWVSPYFAAGFARWWTQNPHSLHAGPGILNQFLGSNADPSRGFDVCMLYPAFGVEFMHPTGVAFFAELQYLFKLFDLANGAYAGMGAHWYF